MLKLYTFPLSPNCYRTELLAALLDQELEKEVLDLWNGKQKSQEYLAVNPRGEVPVLVDGDTTLTDSTAILVYLAGRKPDSGYWSNDVREQALIVDWLAFTSTWILNGLATARAILRFGHDASLEKTQAKARKSLDILQHALNEKRWLCFDRPTIADIAVFGFVALAHEAEVTLEPYPAVKDWIINVKALPGFVIMEGMEGHQL